MALLDEFAALDEIRTILSATDHAKLAVAFWGDGAIERLGLNRSGLTLEILCNLDSGACNPAELRKLLEQPDVTLKSHPALHAKVWWTPAAAVLGSSNASSNGLALEHETGSGWHEANIGVDEAISVEGIRVWFEGLFKAGYDVETEDLDQAENLWKIRKRMAPTGMRLARTLFAAYRASPENPAWQRVKIAYCRDDLDQETKNWMEQEIVEGRLSTGISAYGEWNEKIAPDDYVIDFGLDAAKPAYAGIWQALPAGLHPASLRLVREVQWLPLRTLGRFKVSTTERAALGGVAAAAVQQYSADGRNALITIAQALALFDARTTAADDKAFERAMLDIYEEAKSFGYKPTMFRRMIADHGGVETARRLIRGSATSGFEKLWENKRLDLSVEALVLRPEWRTLFTDAERDLARRRLRQFNYSVGN